MMLDRDAEVLFWSNVDVGLPDRCWPWLGKKKSQGYGYFMVDGKPVGTHRIAWSLWNGEIPEGWWICHQCDNPACVNPHHLWLGDPLLNALDRCLKHGSTSVYPPDFFEHPIFVNKRPTLMERLDEKLSDFTWKFKRRLWVWRHG